MTNPSPLEAIFFAALEKQSPAERSAFLDEACADNEELRGSVDRMLAAQADAGSFLEQPAIAGDATVNHAPPILESPGTVIGPYKLLEQIGEGGMGVVYMAEQQQPVRRKVALKLIKPGMDTRQVIARFEAERQALAVMDHPSIARVLDAGATQSGRPYFVMELVRGVPITTYCDENRLPVRERLELFTSICQAVQHAHTKGIIHRDIKPTNVLVTRQDGRPVVKVIDFGVAKAIGQQLTEKTLFTNFAQMIGTPLYMSPEQAEQSGVDIDTRSDVYSLGVLLYELLAGSTPVDKEQMKKAAIDEVRRIIREDEPQTPSARISGSGTLPAIAAHRQIEPARLSKLVRGELDWIVMKCLEKDRNRRYETANAFAADVQRYLDDEPVQACPPSALYRFRKFARRNKVALVTVSVVVAALLAGTTVATWQAVLATRAKAAAELERQRADEQAAIATSITNYLQQMFGSSDPRTGKGLDYTVRQLLDEYANDLEKQLPDQPEVAATLQATIGRAYSSLGERDKAKRHVGRALLLRRSVFGDKHEDYADSLVDRAWCDTNPSDPSDYPEREADARQALAIYRARGVGGKRVLNALAALGYLLQLQGHYRVPGKWDQIEPVVKEALAEAAKSPGIAFPEIVRLNHMVVEAKIAQALFAEAEKIARESVAMDLRLQGPEHIETAWGYFHLGRALRPQHKFTEALQVQKQALTIMRKVLPPEHRTIAWGMTEVIDTLDLADSSHALANLFPSVAEMGELESMFRQVLTTTKPSKLTNDDPVLAAGRGLIRISGYYWDLSHELASAGKSKEAEESRQKAMLLLESLQRQLSGFPDLLGDVHNYLAWFLATAEVPAHREPARGVELAMKAVESNPKSWLYRNTLGVARYRAGDWKQAISDLEKAASLSNGGNSFGWFFMTMAHWQLGNKEEARKWYDQAVEWMEKNQPKNEELRRFRAEAAELLGVNEKTD